MTIEKHKLGTGHWILMLKVFRESYVDQKYFLIHRQIVKSLKDGHHNRAYSINEKFPCYFTMPPTSHNAQCLSQTKKLTSPC
jgi:hypothetical protein